MASLGVYLHVPFCERVCPYCDFAVVAARTLPEATEDRYVGALLRELDLRREAFAGHRLASVYFGGGTPALLRPASIERLLGAVVAAFPADGEPEVTLEANPRTLERGRLPGFRAAGVSRLSLGVQSFDDGVLRRLGRAAPERCAREAFRAARGAGFANLCLDLIFAAPGQDEAALERDLAEVIACAPEHASAYSLTVEPGTPFAKAAARGQLKVPDEDRAAAMMERVAERFEAAGLRAYEISSFARPGFEAAHNARYWQRLPVLGLGVGAWSTDPRTPGTPWGVRRANPRSLDAWLAAVLAGREAAAEVEVLDLRTARGEAAFLALRTRRGLDALGYAREFGAPPRAHYGDAIDRLCASGLLAESADGDLALTPAGRLLADSVFVHFV